MAKFKNTTEGPKGINTADGLLVYVEAGATSKDLEVSEGELTALRKTEWFEIGETDDDGADDLSDKTVAELKDIAEADGIDLGDATKKADIIAAIQMAREAN